MIGPRGKALWLLAGVFLAGASAGGLTTWAVVVRGASAQLPAFGNMSRPQLIAWWVAREIPLRGDQGERVRQILERHAQEQRSARASCEPALAELRARQQQEIRGLLTPEQLPAFERLVGTWNMLLTR